MTFRGDDCGQMTDGILSRHGLAWLGKSWHGMAWFGTARYGMTRRGRARLVLASRGKHRNHSSTGGRAVALPSMVRWFKERHGSAGLARERRGAA